MHAKKEILDYIKTVASQNVSKAELLEAYEAGKHISSPKNNIPSITLHEILYYIGGLIIFSGVVVLLAQHWGEILYSTKLLATLGSGFSAYLVGVLFNHHSQTSRISNAFHLVGAFAIPIGIAVMLDHEGFQVTSYSIQTWISGFVFCIYFLSYFIFRSNLFILTSILFGTWFFFSLTNFIITMNSYLYTADFANYRNLATGCSYILFGYAFSENKHRALTGFLYGLGVLGVLSIPFAICYGENNNLLWEILFPLFSFGAIFLSVPLKSKAFLTFGTIFLILDIIKLSNDYFSKSLGWPLALVIAGLAIISVSYLAVRVKQRI